MATTITYLGREFDPVSKPVLFEVVQSDELPTSIDIQVSSLININGIKQITNLPVRVNVADYAKAALKSVPITETSNWTTIGRVGVVKVGECSATVVNAQINPIGATAKLLSDLDYRIISEGDTDEISVGVPDGGEIDGVELSGAACVATKVVGYSRDFIAEVARVSVCYKVIPACGKRLCWVNRYGAIDYWTFEIIYSRELAVTKDKIYSGSGWMATRSEQEYNITVGTRALSEKIIEALSYIMQSTNVWLVDGDVLTEIDVISNKTALFNSKDLSTLKIEFRPKIK